MSVGRGAVVPWHSKQPVFRIGGCGRASGNGVDFVWQTRQSSLWMPVWPGAVVTSLEVWWHAVQSFQPSTG